MSASKLGIIVPSADPWASRPEPAYKLVYEAAREVERLVPVLCDAEFFVAGAPLRFSVPDLPAPLPCVCFGPVVPWRRMGAWCAGLRASGLVVMDIEGAGLEDVPDPALLGRVPGAVKRLLPAPRWDAVRCRTVWTFGLMELDESLPLVVKGLAGILRNPSSGDIVQYRSFMREGLVLGAWIAYGDIHPLLGVDRWEEPYPPVWFEQALNIARCGGVPVEWLAYYFGGACFYVAPRYEGLSVLDIPIPFVGGLPEIDERGLVCLALALDVCGSWWALDALPLSRAELPKGKALSVLFEKLRDILLRDGV